MRESNGWDINILNLINFLIFNFLK
jgi:hypothetical protein